MKVLRIAGALTGMLLGFFSLVIAFAFIGWGWSDNGGHWRVAQSALTVIAHTYRGYGQ